MAEAAQSRVEMSGLDMGLVRMWGDVCREDSGGEKEVKPETEKEERNVEWRSLILRLLTVSLEDLRLLMLEARVVLMDLKEAFFLGSGSALPLFLS